jgi:hypothetical protein
MADEIKAPKRSKRDVEATRARLEATYVQSARVENARASQRHVVSAQTVPVRASVVGRLNWFNAICAESCATAGVPAVKPGALPVHPSPAFSSPRRAFRES